MAVSTPTRKYPIIELPDSEFRNYSVFVKSTGCTLNKKEQFMNRKMVGYGGGGFVSWGARRKWGQWCVGFSVVMLLVSLCVLVLARSIAAERTRVPFAGIASNTPITSGVSTITVRNVRHAPGTARFTAPQGYEYLVLTLTVRNNGEKPLNVFPTTDTYVKTHQGNVSYVTPYELKNPFHSGSILPGESTEGELSYLVPQHADYKLYVEASWSGGAVPFVVQSNNNHKRDTP